MADVEADKGTEQLSEAEDLRRLVTAVVKHRTGEQSSVVTEHCLHKIEEVVGSLEGDLNELKMPEGVSVSSWRVSSVAQSAHYKATAAEIKLPSCSVSITEKDHSGTSRVEYTVREGKNEVTFKTTKNIESAREPSPKPDGPVKKLLKGLLGTD